MFYKKRSQAVNNLGKLYDSDPKSVYAVEMQCNAWREILSPHLIKKGAMTSSDKKVIESAILSAPDAPPVPPANDPRWPRSKKFMDNSFSAWTKMGRPTREKFIEKLKE